MKKGKGYPEHVKDTGKVLAIPMLKVLRVDVPHVVRLMSGPKKHGKPATN